MSFSLSLKESSTAKRARTIAESHRPAEPAFAAADDPSETSDVHSAAPELDIDTLKQLRDSGCASADAGDFKAAISSWSRVIRAGEAGPDVHNWIAQAYMELDEDWRAVHHAEIGYSGDSAFALTYARALFNYGELGKCKDTILDNLEKASGEDKKDLQSLLADVRRISSLVEKDMAEHHRGAVVNGRTITMPFWETAQKVDYDEEGRPHVQPAASGLSKQAADASKETKDAAEVD
ncbi:hypothetical protein FOZ63_008516 [Perkinsus olseni]|uniref:Uncharacterized protein n=1 Tax=Perkinsus olseni TaxID=32597 RepID=A0A7J6UBE6_PEROL|nr:hypothetical protein FOZ63_008516 [Perkinsus olseni]KAF4754511.1 hypothetical protein FOZ62_026668 [Perkinsus olseni]